jgi:hypothetical protein
MVSLVAGESPSETAVGCRKTGALVVGETGEADFDGIAGTAGFNAAGVLVGSVSKL